MLKHTLRLGAFLLVFALVFPVAAGGDKDKKRDDPKYNNPTFVPTADEVIYKMFEMGKVNKNDVIFDLGCGDNRICYMAAKKFRCRGVGIETNPVRIREAMDKFDELNRGDAITYGDSIKLPLVETRHGDALAIKDLGDATMVVMYMFPEFMTLWQPIAEKHLKPGTRILSHDYQWEYDKLPNAWKPVREETVKSSHRDNHRVIMWIVPEKGKKSNSSTNQ
jgi:hypothetical protein